MPATSPDATIVLPPFTYAQARSLAAAVEHFADLLNRAAAVGGPDSAADMIRGDLPQVNRLSLLKVIPPRGEDGLYRWPLITPAEDQVVRNALTLLHDSIQVLANFAAPIGAEKDLVAVVREKVNNERTFRPAAAQVTG